MTPRPGAEGLGFPLDIALHIWDKCPKYGNAGRPPNRPRDLSRSESVVDMRSPPSTLAARTIESWRDWFRSRHEARSRAERPGSASRPEAEANGFATTEWSETDWAVTQWPETPSGEPGSGPS